MENSSALPTIPETQTKPSFHFHALPLLIYTIIIILLTSGAFILGMRYSSKKTPSTIPTATIPTSIPTALPTINPTADWKTYTNTKYNFEFRYPENLIVVGNDDYATLNTELDIKQPGRDNKYGFSVELNNTINDYIKNIQNMIAPGTNIKQTEVTIGTNKFLKIEYTDAMTERQLYVISHKNNIISLSFSDQILSTFKFTE